jgi:hypothetical protein
MQAFGSPVIVPFEEHYAPDVTVCIWLKNRKPEAWRAKPDNPDTKEDALPVQVSVEVRDARRRPE